MSRQWQGGSTRAWRRTRALVLQRDGGVCRVRIEGVCTHVATCVHHTRGRAVTGDDPRFLVASCAQCNRAVGDPTRTNPQPKRISKW